MADLKIRNLEDDLSFGARVEGVTLESLKDEAGTRKIALAVRRSRQ